ncbi:E22 family MetX-like putative esterase [Aquabacter spiritensis]|uniref:Probable acyltransferase n=1 Tax=Aquabacter spiritensis TaxID=933073 RepID=A0A4V6NZI9_9HYPH|nr:homoserine O-acetyltransferase [Aquabacter spiritensis]TCT04578.1 homoserine O-acetyltransferase [Aquabacter spiritensis]
MTPTASSHHGTPERKRVGAIVRIAALLGAFALAVTPAAALDALVQKQTFTLPSYTTVGGAALRDVKVGWEAYGTLNAEKSNVILITHFFSGTSHAAGRYKPTDPAPGYWDAIIGPGKPLDTDKYYILSSDTLVNLNAHDPNVVTTGPATKAPDTGAPYGPRFPLVTIRDFVNVQKALLDELGIAKLHAVMGPSMGALQAYEWATGYPEVVGRIVPVIGSGDADGWLVAWLDAWASPIRLDPNFNGGNYYGRAAPKAGLTQALKIVTLSAGAAPWANTTFGRKWAEPGKDPAQDMANKYAVEAKLDEIAAARAELADANHFLYLVKANQIFAAGGDVGLARITAPVLLISSDGDLLFHPSAIQRTADEIRKGGAPVEQVKISGGRGHLDGIANIQEAGEAIRRFLDK